MVHTWRGRGCSIFIEINVKSQTHLPSKCAAFNNAQHKFSPAKLFQNMIFKSVHHFGTTAGVIRFDKKADGEKMLNLSPLKISLFSLQYVEKYITFR